MKKAQIEIMGLMVIVLIIIFVILISLKFFISPKTDVEGFQRQSIQTSNMLNAIVRSNTADGSTITNKIVECYNSGDYPSSEQCEFMRDNFENEVLKKAFVKKKYQLKFIGPGNLDIFVPYGIENLEDPNDGCQNQAKIKSSALVSVSPRITAELILCVQPQQSIA